LEVVPTSATRRVPEGPTMILAGFKSPLAITVGVAG
jgi:hypothetical protein